VVYKSSFEGLGKRCVQSLKSMVKLSAKDVIRQHDKFKGRF
jgi:hypothetical protein